MIQEYINNPAKLAKDVKQMVYSGEVNPLMVKIMYDVFSEAMKDMGVRDAINQEADKYEGEFEIGGFRFTKAHRKTYDFKHDSEWQRLEGMRKARENLMKLALEQDVADPNTGEIVHPAVVKKSEFIRRV